MARRELRAARGREPRPGGGRVLLQRRARVLAPRRRPGPREPLSPAYRGRPLQSSATAPPQRYERWGARGPCRGPRDGNHSRAAPRLRRGAANAGGLGGHVGAPVTVTTPEQRHGPAGALRTLGGLGAISGPP